LVPQNTTLLVIDLQEDFLSPTGYFARRGYDPSPLRAILPAVNRIVEAARAAGLTIIHTRQGYRADMADMTPCENIADSLGQPLEPHPQGLTDPGRIALSPCRFDQARRARRLPASVRLDRRTVSPVGTRP